MKTRTEKSTTCDDWGEHDLTKNDSDMIITKDLCRKMPGSDITPIYTLKLFTCTDSKCKNKSTKKTVVTVAHDFVGCWVGLTDANVFYVYGDNGPKQDTLLTAAITINEEKEKNTLEAQVTCSWGDAT